MTAYCYYGQFRPGCFALQYQGEQDLPLIMTLVDNELSEPYSIFTYRRVPGVGNQNMNRLFTQLLSLKISMSKRVQQFVNRGTLRQIIFFECRLTAFGVAGIFCTVGRIYVGSHLMAITALAQS